jgi:UDP-N-acetylmuramoyl-L-alanyl-D-glutamate--2,6-diaminopimelate ligase
VKLADLVDGSGAAGSVEVRSLVCDIDGVQPGTLFFCISDFGRGDLDSGIGGPGAARAAVANGAVALVVEQPLGLGVPEVVVPDVRAAVASAAARFHGHPSARLQVIGITGTNGKTTTAFLVRALIEATGERCGLVGTVKSVIGGVEGEVACTTPDSIGLHAGFRAMVDAGDSACAIEVSSHALELHRVDSTRFAAAVFTNLTQDHLDFHRSMDEYWAAKRRLFELSPGIAVLNVGDPYGRRLAREYPDAVTFALDGVADYSAHDLRLGRCGAEFVAVTPVGRVELRSPLLGRYNVANVLGAVAVAHQLGVPMQTIARTLPAIEPVPGRMQLVDVGQPFLVYVDYAHTPDALANLLRAARALTERRLLCVFGCGGDRDRGKRPQMGRIAAELSDEVLVTSNDPGSESPDAIATEVLAGIARSNAAMVATIADRRMAIARAIELAGPGDVIVITGKGHEKHQKVAGGRRLPFDDAIVAREELLLWKSRHAPEFDGRDLLEPRTVPSGD